MKQPGKKNPHHQTERPAETVLPPQSRPAGTWSPARAQALRSAAKQRKPSACNCY